MPGVPSGRACEACRKQKKKCDELKPSCSRCNRLHIQCNGSGLRRFKFMGENKSEVLSGHQTTRHFSSQEIRAPQQEFSRTLSTETTLLADALIMNLKASDDLKYHLPWTYGGFIEDIPRHMGTNLALDTAVAALLSSLATLPLHHGTDTSIPIVAVTKYTYALKTLRITLDDITMARKTETLCAVMLLLMCQQFLGAFVGCWSTHGEGAVQILKARSFYNAQDDFECKLLLSLRGPILFEALINPRIAFTSKEWKILVENELDGTTPEGAMMRCLARAPGLIQRRNDTLRRQAESEILISDTKDQYQIITSLLSKFRDRFDAVQNLSCSAARDAIPLMKAHSHYQRTYGIGLAVCLIYNCILTTLDSSNANLDLDSSHFCNELLEIADQAAIYRPLGASYITFCLMTAWCGCRNMETRVIVERKLDDYRMDFPGAPAERFKANLEYTLQRLSLLGL